MGFFSFLFKSDKNAVPLSEPILVDMHSHFLPGIDDGATNLDECLGLLKTFEDRGYQKIITTPHIIQDLYENTPETILPVLAIVKKALAESGSSLQIHAAAEYYMDENFIKLLDNDAPLLTLKDNLVLVETAFMNEPANLREIFFKIRLKGYKPVFAHPERYMFLQNRKEKVEELFDSGVYLQINTMSLGGYYGLPAMKLAEWMIEQGFVHFLGSDCHRVRHLEPLAKAYQSKAYKKIRELTLLNDTLL